MTKTGATLVKSENDGHWYYFSTQWSYILDYLTDALASFSEKDMNDEIYILIEKLCDDVYLKLKSENEC